LCSLALRGPWQKEGAAASVRDLQFPKFSYYLDESDPDIVVLRRQDDTFAAAFSARGVTREGIVEAAREDYRELLEANAASLELREEGDIWSSA
jgi:hypothetical protein